MTESPVPKDLQEYKKFAEGAERSTARIAVLSSELGPGLLEIDKTIFKSGFTLYHPSFYPTHGETYVCDGETRKYSEPCEAPKGGYKNWKHALRLMRERYKMGFRNKSFNTADENDEDVNK